MTAAWKSGSLAISWSAVSRATGYNVSYSTDQQASWTQVGANVSGTTLTAADVDTGATVHARVQSVNSVGTSGWTTSGAIDPPAPTSPPDAPDWVTLAWQNGTLVISWSAVEGASGHNVVIHEHLTGWRTVGTNVTGTTLTVTDADTTGLIWVGVQSVNSAGTSTHTYKSINPPSATKPETPSSVTLTRADGTVTANWPASARAAHYHVTYSSDGGASWSLGASAHAGTTITIEGLDNAKTYIVGVRAGNSGGWSSWKNSPPADPFDPPTEHLTKPEKPTSVTLTRADGTVTATWPAPAGAETYHITYSSQWGRQLEPCRLGSHRDHHHH